MNTKLELKNLMEKRGHSVSESKIKEKIELLKMKYQYYVQRRMRQL